MFLCEVEDEIISYLALPPKCNQLPSVGSGISICGGEGWCGEGAQYSLFFFLQLMKNHIIENAFIFIIIIIIFLLY